jgi:hypothetical protein
MHWPKNDDLWDGKDLPQRVKAIVLKEDEWLPVLAVVPR